MVRSLRAALARLNCIRPELCWEYLKAWSADQEKWRLYLDGLPAGQPLEDAVEAVRRLGVSVLLRRPRHKPVTRSSLELEVWRYGSRPVPATPWPAGARSAGPEADLADHAAVPEPSNAA
jgi:hypothetical protein